ncbi:MAG TPA: crossover junction endodeoxyribonuclease RuvC [Burkholderiaceae bacterium]|nr:crossover junction endodeoxyribonuclease RuvC [Burkholderiaceae bacterium]
MERILGIDPGLRLTGFGVVERHGANRLAYVASGVIRVPDGELPVRLATIFAQLREVIAEYRPDAAAVEKVFVNVNPHSTLLLGQARGAAICAAATSGLPVAEYTALQVKQAVVGYGRATKEQVQAMVVRLLALPGTPSKDAADALACAACHAHGGALLGALVAGAATLPVPTVLARRGVRVRRGRVVAS